MFAGEWSFSLPSELIARVLDYLELHDLFAPLAVSRHWRRVALDHPTYWRYIRLLSPSDNAIDLFLLRVAQARKRKIFLEVSVSIPCRRISDDVLPVLASRMDQIQNLWTAVHYEQADDLFAALRHPAPALEGFEVFIITPRSIPLPKLPGDTFCGNAPKLEFAGFRDVELFNVSYPAFASVIDVDFGFTRSETFYVVPTLFAIFPRMRRFGLHSGRLRVPEDLEFPTGLPSGVETLECSMNPSSLKFLVGVIPYDQMPSFRVRGAGADIASRLVQQLSGDLSVDFCDRRQSRKELFDICVSSTETKFKRIFGQTARRYLAGVRPPISFLRDYGFAERLVQLTMPDTLWGFLARHLLPFPNLKELVVRLDSGTLPVLGKKWSISCAKLECLRLATGTGDVRYAQTEKLAAFVAVSLAELPLSPLPMLQLDGVILEGDEDIVRPHLRMPTDPDSSPVVPVL